jgi:hypothetical protein
MSLDERLEELLRSLKLRAAMQYGNEQRFRNQFDEAAAESSQNKQMFAQVAFRFHEVGDYIDSLARIAGVHQERLDSHE